MAWIEGRRRKDGTISWWVRDVRGGRQVCISAASRREAEFKREQYMVRRDLEKEGYDDKYASNQEAVLDRLWGPKQDILKKATQN